MVLFVSLGVVLTGLGLYDAVVDFGGAGATVPIVGFGYALAKGVEKGIAQYGLAGILSGGITASSAGIAAAVIFGWLAVLSKSSAKSPLPLTEKQSGRPHWPAGLFFF